MRTYVGNVESIFLLQSSVMIIRTTVEDERFVRETGRGNNLHHNHLHQRAFYSTKRRPLAPFYYTLGIVKFQLRKRNILRN